MQPPPEGSIGTGWAAQNGDEKAVAVTVEALPPVTEAARRMRRARLRA